MLFANTFSIFSQLTRLYGRLRRACTAVGFGGGHTGWVTGVFRHVLRLFELLPIWKWNHRRQASNLLIIRICCEWTQESESRCGLFSPISHLTLYFSLLSEQYHHLLLNVEGAASASVPLEVLLSSLFYSNFSDGILYFSLNQKQQIKEETTCRTESSNKQLYPSMKYININQILHLAWNQVIFFINIHQKSAYIYYFEKGTSSTHM